MAALTWGSGAELRRRRRRRERRRASRNGGSYQRESPARRGIFLATRKRTDQEAGTRAVERGSEGPGLRRQQSEREKDEAMGEDRGGDEEGEGGKGKFRRAHLSSFLDEIDQRPRETD